jgi:hypothetical protein
MAYLRKYKDPTQNKSRSGLHAAALKSFLKKTGDEKGLRWPTAVASKGLNLFEVSANLACLSLLNIHYI